MSIHFRKRIKLFPVFWFNSHMIGTHCEPVDQSAASDPPSIDFAFPAWVLVALFAVVQVLVFWY